MTSFMRKLLTFVMLLASFAPLANLAPVSAQSTVDGSGCWQAGQLSISGAKMTWSSPPATIIDPAKTYQAKFETTAGEILIQLDPIGAPIATNNFICLALAGYYSGTDFHRIFANTLIQGGDPTASGTGGPGYVVPSDPTVGSYPAGVLAMASSAPNQNGSQFFITAADLTGRIPNDYPVFGKVIGGMETVVAISNGAVTANTAGEQSKPVDPSVLISVTILSPVAQSAGPVVTSPTATTAAIVPTAIPTTAPTVATGSGAQSRPGSAQTGATTPTPVTAATTGGAGCEGFEDYQSAFDDTYLDVAVKNPDALAFLMSMQNNDTGQSMFEQMTADQATAMSAFYYDLADAIATLTPPAFAAQWQAVQIQIFKALGDFTANIASQGLQLASIQASGVMTDLSHQSDAALAAATTACPAFQSWATGEPDDSGN